MMLLLNAMCIHEHDSLTDAIDMSFFVLHSQIYTLVQDVGEQDRLKEKDELDSLPIARVIN
jgi:hypothetical protein